MTAHTRNARPGSPRLAPRLAAPHLLAPSLLAALLLGSVTACGGGTATTTGATSTGTVASAATAMSPSHTAVMPTMSVSASGTAPVSTALTLTDAWAKAVPDTTKNTMTAVFGTVRNTSTAAVTISSVTTSASMMAELHETVEKNGEKVMQRVEKGFTIEAGASREFKPGGDHIMIMNLKKAVAVGDEVAVTLTLSDGSTVAFTAVAKDFTAADERYATTTP